MKRPSDLLDLTKKLLAMAALAFIAATPALASGPGELGFDENTFEVIEEAGLAVITVERSGGEDGVVSVDYRTTTGTATEGADYTDVSGTLTWADDDGSDRVFTVPILDDAESEAEEIVQLVLSNPTGGAGLDGQQSVSVLVIEASDGGEDDSEDSDSADSEDSDSADSADSDSADSEDSDSEDSDSADSEDSDSADSEDSDSADSEDSDGADSGGQSGTLKFDEESFEVMEDAGVAIVTVERSKGETGAVSVDYMTFDDSAIDGVDYTGVAGTLSWADGDGGNKTLMVPIVDDGDDEGNETVDLQLMNPTGGAVLDAQRGTAVLTIVDDDGSGCTPNDQTLCLLGGRFKVNVAWRTFDQATGPGRPVSLSDQSGLLWFFDPGNVEILFKVLDGCSINGSYWVFFAATTDLGVDLTVTDTVTGQTRTYSNPLGRTAEPVQDVTTFTGCN